MGLFGTDGVRGLANGDILTAPLALSLATAAATELIKHSANRRPLAVVGRDPRASGEMLEHAVCAGLTCAGVDVLLVGVLPTPAVAYLTADYGADLGVMISASHNPMPDNGIKFFAAGGRKLDDSVEARIEQLMHTNPPRPVGAQIGRVRTAYEAAEDRYLRYLTKTIDIRLDPIKVVVDNANGAASSVATLAYRAAGADVIPIHSDPTGLNINEQCGSTHLDDLRASVVKHGADLGIAHDGDADRCLAVDASGNVIDGDVIMAIIAIAMNEAGTLKDNTLVATIMSNLGLHLAMKDAGIALKTTSVGDRYVLEELRAGGYSLGGEQSGHVVIPEFATTGDGLLTALHLMERMVRTNKSLAELAAVMTILPQRLVNVRVADKGAVMSSTKVHTVTSDCERELGETGRILLRPSGTEDVFRVMVEAPDHATADRIATTIADVVAGV